MDGSEENRLSASFAAVLEHAPNLGRALASEWTHLLVTGDLTVDVQHWCPSGWIDVELRFGDPTRPDVSIWIGAKYGAGLSGEDQIEKYQRDLIREPAAARLLLLAMPAEFDAKGLDVDRPARVNTSAPKTLVTVWASASRARPSSDSQLASDE